MRILLLLAVLTVPLVAVVAVLAAVGQAGRARGGTAREPDGARPWLRWGGLVVGLLAATALSQREGLGLGLLLGAPAAAFGLLLGVLAAELSVRPPDGPRRTASLATRRAADYLPRVLTSVVGASLVALLAVSATTTALASPDDMGRAGRWLSAACSATSSAARGPFPGSYYTVPLLVAVAAGAVLALVVLRVTVARPPLQQAGATGPDGLAADHELRAQAARAVVAGVGVLVSLPLAAVSALAASALGGMDGCGPQWWGGLSAALLVVAAAAVVVLVWCTAVALLGRHQPAALPVRGAAG